MKTLYCCILVLINLAYPHLAPVQSVRTAFADPARASDLRTFYRAIRALSRSPVLNETAVAIV
jgi:hypothetical protein